MPWVTDELYGQRSRAAELVGTGPVDTERGGQLAHFDGHRHPRPHGAPALGGPTPRRAASRRFPGATGQH
ncbi:MAG: hypothetical protein L0H64_10475, partial [Pseudonocardia sp.]|nr:hypothetical protein [Pseudonocardia sp.]